MPKFRPLLLSELCCLSLLLLQAQTYGAPATTPSVPDHDEFLPLVEEDTAADRRLIHAERSVFLNPESKELRIVWKFFKERSQELQGRDTLSSNDDNEEEKKLLNVQPKVQFEKQRIHDKQGKQRREEQRDDRKKESEWTRAGRDHSHEYSEDEHRGCSFVQRGPLRIRGNRYCAGDNERECERYEATATKSAEGTVVGGTKKNFTETRGYKAAALEKMHQEEPSNSTPQEATSAKRTRYSNFDGVAYEERGRSGECTSSCTEGAGALPVLSTSDENVPQLDADGAEVGTESDEPKSFSPERHARELEGLSPYLPSTSGCRSVDEYKFLNPVKEGAYGIVYRAWEKRTGKTVALKKLKSERYTVGVPITTFPEIRMLLKAGKHPNIVNLQEVVLSSNMDRIYLVMEFIDRDLRTAIETVYFRKGCFTTGEVKHLFRQLLTGVAYLHDNWILHRDLKPPNLLLTNEGILKIGDFGLSREYGNPPKPYSPDVITLWYRPPELLLGVQEYSTAVDMWSCGCIFAELLKMRPLFPGDGELDQIVKIFTDLGTPNNTIWSGYSRLPVPKKVRFKEREPGGLEEKFTISVIDKKGLELLKKLLTYDPALRLSARGALHHEWFLHRPAPSTVYMTVYEQRRGEKRKSTLKTLPNRVVGRARHEDHSVEIDKSLEDLQIESKKEKAGPSSAMQFD